MGTAFSKCTNIDLEKATALIMNHRDEQFVKHILIHMMEEYAKTTDNDIDDKFVSIFREKINPDNQVVIRFRGYEDEYI